MRTAGYFALSIGISRYECTFFPPIDAAAIDVGTFARALAERTVSVETIGLTDPSPSRSQVLAAINRAHERLPSGATLIVHISAHGVSVGGELYVVPSDCPDPRERIGDIRQYLVPISVLQGRFAIRPPARTLLLFDACRKAIPNIEAEAPFWLNEEDGSDEQAVETFTIFASPPGGAAWTNSDAGGPSVFTLALGRLLDAGWSPAPHSASMAELEAAVSAADPAMSSQAMSWSARLRQQSESSEPWIPGGTSRPIAIAEALQSLARSDGDTPIAPQRQLYKRQSVHALAALGSWPSYQSLLSDSLAHLQRLIDASETNRITAGVAAVAAELIVDFASTMARTRSSLVLDARRNAAVLLDLETIVNDDGAELLPGIDDWATAQYSARVPSPLSDALLDICPSSDSRRQLEVAQTLFKAMMTGNAPLESRTRGALPGALIALAWDKAHSEQVQLEEVLSLALAAGYMTLSPALFDVDYVREYLVQPHHVHPPSARTLGDALWIKTRQGFDLDAVCAHPALDLAIRSRIELFNTLAVPAFQRADLQRTHLSAASLRPSRRSDGAPAYELPHCRFELSTEKTRALLMGTELYGNPTLAFRELLQNAVDACGYRLRREKFLAATVPDYQLTYQPHVCFRIGVDSYGTYVECEDNGVGMSIADISSVFSKAGVRFQDTASYAIERESWRRVLDDPDWVPNSRFGIGVFSYFMVADSLAISTTQFKSDGSFSDGLLVRISAASSLFHTQRMGHRDPSRGGTRVRLYLNSVAARRPNDCAETLLALLRLPQVDVTYEDGPTRIAWNAGCVYRNGTEIASVPSRTDPAFHWVIDSTSMVLSGIGGYADAGFAPDRKAEVALDRRSQWSRALLMNRTVTRSDRARIPSKGIIIELGSDLGVAVSVDRKSIKTWSVDRWRQIAAESVAEIFSWPELTWRWLLELYVDDRAEWLQPALTVAARSAEQEISVVEPGGRAVKPNRTDLLELDARLLGFVSSETHRRLAGSEPVARVSERGIRPSPLLSARLFYWFDQNAPQVELPFETASRTVDTYPDLLGGWERIEHLLVSCRHGGPCSTSLARIQAHPDFAGTTILELLDRARDWALLGFAPPVRLGDPMKGFLNEERLVGIIRRSDSLLRFLFSDASPHRSCVDDFGGTAIGLDLFLDVCVELQCAPQELLEYLTQRGVSVTDASDSAWTSFESPLTRDQLLYLSQDFDGQPPWRPTASRATLLCKDLLGVGVAPDWVEAEAVFGELFGADTGKWIRNFDGATAQNFDQYHTARFPTHEHKDAKHWSTGLGRGLSPRPQVLWSDGLTDRRTAEFAAASSAVCLSSERDIPLSAAIAALVAAGAPDCSMVFDRRALGRQVGAGWAGTLASVIGTAVDGQGSIGAEVALGAIEARSSDAAVVSELATWLSQDVAEPLFGEIDVSDRRRERGELCLLSTDLDPLGAIPRRLTAFAQFRVAARLGVALDVAHTHLASIAPVGVELADVSDLGDLRPSWDCVRHFANRWGDAANAGVPDDDWFRQATATWLAVRPTTEDPST